MKRRFPRVVRVGNRCVGRVARYSRSFRRLLERFLEPLVSHWRIAAAVTSQRRLFGLAEHVVNLGVIWCQRRPPLARDYIVEILLADRVRGARGRCARGRAQVGLLMLDAYFGRAHRRLLLDPRVPLLPRSAFGDTSLLTMIGSLGPGGAERQLVTLLRGLPAHGYSDLQLVGLFLDSEVNNFFRPQVDASRVRIDQIRRDPVPPSALLAAFPDDTGLREFVARNASAVPPEMVEIWHYLLELLDRRPGVFHGWMDDVNVKGGIAAAIAGVPRIVLGTRSVAPDNFGLFQPFMRSAYRALARSPHVVILNNSEAGARDYERWLGVPRGSIHVVRNGFDFASFDAVDRSRARADYRARHGLGELTCVVGTIIRFTEEKQPFLWLGMAVLVAERHPDARFLMLGDGPLRAEVLRRAKEAGLGDRFLAPGYENDAMAALAAMDLFVLTSRAEGLPNVLIEAQAMGVPVVAPEVGGAAETFRHGEGGWLVTRIDSEAFAKKVSDVVADPALLRAAGLRGRATVRESFAAERMVRQTLGHYFEPLYERVFRRMLATPPLLGEAGVEEGTLLIAIGTLGPGGTERQLVNLLRCARGERMRRRTLLGRHLTDPPHDFFRALIPDDVSVVEISGTGSPWEQLLAVSDGMPGVRELERSLSCALPEELLDVVRYLRQILRVRPAIVHTWLDEMNIKVGMAAAVAGVPRIVLSTRNVAPHRFRLWQPWFREGYLALLQRPGVVMLNNSKAGARDYEEWLELPRGTIRVVLNGVDVNEDRAGSEASRRRVRERFHLEPEALVVGTIIRFAEEKRPFLWLDVARFVASQLPATRFLMVGDGPLLHDARNHARANGLDDRVLFTGHLGFVREILAAMDVFLLTSRLEGLPNVLLEAQAEGVPVVSTDAGGARETFLDRQTGILVSRDSAEAIAEGVVEALRNGGWRDAVRGAAPRLVRDRFAIGAMAAATLDAYHARGAFAAAPLVSGISRTSRGAPERRG